jgi:hypothetical protein
MDGFALATAGAGASAGDELPVAGESLAGRPFDRDLRPGEAIRIMTGAVVPAGADAVVPVEQTSGFGGVAVRIAAAVRAGANIRRHGSECAADAVVLPAGSLVRAAEIGVLAVLGHAAVQVRCRPRVGIVATGDEVVPIDAVPLPHQVRESNSWALAAQVEECGGAPTRLGVAPDEAATLGLRQCNQEPSVHESNGRLGRLASDSERLVERSYAFVLLRQLEPRLHLGVRVVSVALRGRGRLLCALLHDGCHLLEDGGLICILGLCTGPRQGRRTCTCQEDVMSEAIMR